MDGRLHPLATEAAGSSKGRHETGEGQLSERDHGGDGTSCASAFVACPFRIHSNRLPGLPGGSLRLLPASESRLRRGYTG
jgi:hypothetical protein